MYLDCTQGAHDLALRRDLGCAWPGLSTDDQLALGGRRADGYARHSDRSGQWGIKRVRALRTRLIAGGVALLAMVLAGCTGAPPPTSPPITGTYSPSPTATTEDLPGPPGYPFPPEAMEYTEAGALAFFNYYIDLLNKTAENLDSEPVRLLAGPDCFTCDRIVEMYEEDLAAGYRYEGGVTTVTQTPVTASLLTDAQDRPGMQVAVDGHGSAFTVVDETGAPVPDREYPAYDIVIVVVATWFAVQSTWQVTSLTLDVR